jgi:hypothetical protein
VRLLLIDDTVPNELRRLTVDGSLSGYVARGGDNALVLADLDKAGRDDLFRAVYAAVFGKTPLGQAEDAGLFLMEFQHAQSGKTAVEVALPYLETTVRPGRNKVRLLLPGAVRARSIDDRLKLFAALELDPQALALCAAATIAGPLPWEEAQRLYPKASRLVKDVAEAAGAPAGDAVPSFGEGEADRLIALCVLADRPLPERHAMAALAWSRASTRTAAFVAACASVRYSDDQRLPSRAYGWLVYPPPANAARCEDWLLLVYALYTYLLADKPDWSALGPTLITAVQEVDDEMLAQSASIALAAFLEVRSDTFSAAEIRGVLSAATLLCRRWPDNKTTVIAAADLAVLAASRLSRDLQDVEGLAASAPVLEEVTRVDLSQSSSFLGQQLSELRLRALAMLARAPWPSGLAPLEEIQRIRQAFPATRGILGAAATAVAALAADDRVLAEGLAAERQAVDAALAACDSIDETIGRLRALLGFGRDAQSPPTLNELVAVRRRHGRSRALHEALAEALKKDRPAWPQADLAAERQAIAETLAAGDFDPPDSDMTLRRFLHEHRLQYRTPG